MRTRRVLILRPDNIGDVILFSGALQHIRRLYPRSHITLAVQAHIVNLMELCPHIDRCIPINQLTWCERFAAIGFLVNNKKLKKIINGLNRFWNAIIKPYHIIIYPVKSPQIHHLETAYILKAEQTFGVKGCNINFPGGKCLPELLPESQFMNVFDISNADPWTHELVTTSEFLRSLGSDAATIENVKPVFWVSGVEKQYLSTLEGNGTAIIGIFPCASSVDRCWDNNNYGILSRLLGGCQSYVIFGSVADIEVADKVALSIRSYSKGVEILNLAGQTTLRELIGAISKCDLLISVDSSGLHMAIAADVPSIGIVGGGHFGRFVPWGDEAKHVFLTKKMECFHCNWECCKDSVECIQSISPQQVASVARKMLFR